LGGGKAELLQPSAFLRGARHARRPSRTSIPFKIQDLNDWLARTTGAPREISKQARIKAILGLPAYS